MRENSRSIVGILRGGVLLLALLGHPPTVAGQARTADPAQRGVALTEFPRFVKLADNVYGYEEIRQPGFTTVSLVVIGRDGVLLADGQGTVQATRTMLDRIRTLSPLPVRWYVVGSDHSDHTGGNAALPKDVTVISRESLGGNDKTIDVGGTAVQVLFLGRAHTGTDLSVHLPRERILFMSEAYLNRVFPAMRSAFPSEWVAVVDRALAMDVDRFVPGHGFIEEPAASREELVAFRDALAQVIAEVKRLHARGLSAADATAQAAWGPYAGWFLREQQAPIAVRKVYEEIEGKLAPVVFDTLARSSLAQLDGRVALRGLRDSVRVIRDRWGVPHIYAGNIDDLFFAQGFVQAQDRLWQMEMYRRTFEGRLSEIMGASYIEHDRLARLVMFRGPFDDREWQSYHPEGRRIFDAFAAGVNAYISQAGDRLPVEFRLTGLKPTPWTPEVALLRTTTAMPTADALAELRLAQSVARLGADSANRLARPSPFRPLSVPGGVDLSIIGPEVIASLSALRTGTVRPPLLPQFASIRDALPSDNLGVHENSPGSNNWVISGSRTASGNVIVANDPHRNVANPSIRYIVHLDAPGWQVAGATEPVLPGVMIGRTEHIGWGLTIVGTDQADVYVEELDRADHERVRFGNGWERMRTLTDTIHVRDAAPVIVTHRFTRHGPVFHMDTARHRAYSMRTTAHLPGSAGYVSALRYHSLRDCAGFLDAQRYYLAPTENMICGDTRGNIAWQASSAAPRRPNWDGRLPVPGGGTHEWNGLRADLPREWNPARGWIATANHDIHPDGYDPPLFFKQGPQRARFDRIASVLSGSGKFSMTDMMALQHDGYSEQGARDIPLFAGWTASDSVAEWGRVALARWDAQHRRESAAAALHHYASRSMNAAARAEADAGRRRALIESAIRAGMDSLQRTQGADRSQWRWGRINRSELPHPLLRAYDIPPVERHGGAGFVAAVGATFREVMDLGHPDSTFVTNVPGQSGQPGSPFYRNLVEPYGRGEYFPLAFTREAVERAAAHRLVLLPVR